jgi:hypothetical protein
MFRGRVVCCCDSSAGCERTIGLKADSMNAYSVIAGSLAVDLRLWIELMR